MLKTLIEVREALNNADNITRIQNWLENRKMIGAAKTKLTSLIEAMESPEMVEKFAIAISGAPFPSAKSIGKAKAVLAALEKMK